MENFVINGGLSASIIKNPFFSTKNETNCIEKTPKEYIKTFFTGNS